MKVIFSFQGYQLKIMNLKNRGLCIFFVLAAGCSSQNADYEVIQRELESRNSISLNEYKSMIFIPPSGCNECISEAELLLKQECLKDSSEILFIITGYKYGKSIKVRLGKEVIDKTFVWLDTILNYNKEPFLLPGKPRIFITDKGQIVKEGSIQLVNDQYVIL